MIALLIGAVLAVTALVFVLLPLFDARIVLPAARARPAGPAQPRENPVDALREIEFDRATGKLSDDDYNALKAKYTRNALVEMRARKASSAPAEVVVTAASVAAASPGTDTVVDAAEAAILRYRAVTRECASCGPRPEPDPVFCSSCGTYLKDACAACGAPVDAPASRFCANCGSSLAA